MKKLIGVIALLLLASLSLAQDKLTVWFVGGDDALPLYQPLIDAFKAKNEGVELETLMVPWGDAYPKFIAAAASGTGPDVITSGSTFPAQLGPQGGMVNLTADYPDIVEVAKAKALPATLNSQTMSDGAMYGVPFDTSRLMFMYLPEKIATPPATWDELKAAVAEQQAAGGKGLAIQWGNANWIGFHPFLESAGGSFYDEGCTKSTLSDPAAVDALTFFASLYSEYGLPTDGWPDLEGGLVAGDYVMGMSGDWLTYSLPSSRPELAGKWAIAPIPAGPSGKSVTFVGGTSMSIMSYSQNKDLAADFIRTYFEDGMAETMTEAANAGNKWFVPARNNLADMITLPDGFKEVMAAQYADGAGPPNCMGWEENTKAVDEAIQAVIFNGDDPAAALANAAAALDKGLQ